MCVNPWYSKLGADKTTIDYNKFYVATREAKRHEETNKLGRVVKRAKQEKNPKEPGRLAMDHTPLVD